ncbi:MAG TPA: hypothetical protein VJ826_00485, partial [Candidatus Polarisedimenticolaceae bacterium]|nr:hypothetical protein [Candidatus Polarisedimenticolaceae bacterium]
LTPRPASAQTETIIASDNFNRANEAPFAIGGNWGRVIAGNYDGVSNLTNNQVTSVSNEGIYYWKGPGTFDSTRQFARQKVVQKDGELGLVLLGGADQAIMVAWGPPGVGDTVYIYWYKDGSDRGQLATRPSTVANGDIVEAALDGGVIYAKVNGVTVASVPNTTTLTSGTPGFVTYLNPSLPGQVSVLDDWEAGTPSSYTISGTITRNGTGLGGVLVTASGGFSGNGTTDGNGDYTITGVPSDATSILLTPTGHSMSPPTRMVSGPVIGDVTGQDFTATLSTDFTLTLHAVHGSVTKNPDQPTYGNGTNVTLTPVPVGGYTFAGWSGQVPIGHESDDPLDVTMSQNLEITAHFLSDGVIASDHFNRTNETPLAVGGNWVQPFAGGSVNLTNNQVASGSGEALYYWQGAGTFNDARQFARLKVLQAGGQVGLVLLGGINQGLVVSWGSGRLFIYWYLNGVSQGELANIAATLQAGDEIEAVLDQGRVFAKLNGVVIHSVANTTSLTSGKPGFETYLSGAVFDDWEAGTPPTYTISGTITENLAGLSGVLVTATGGFSGSTTTDVGGYYELADVPFGAASVLLRPTLFGHSMSPPTRAVNGPFTADVSGQDFTSTGGAGGILTTNAMHGSVTRDPDLPAYSFGQDVTLTAVPDPGYHFVTWQGDVPAGHAADNPLHVTMDQDRTITAVFLATDVVAWDNFNRPDELPLTVGGNWIQPFGGGFDNLTSNRVAGASGEALYFWQGAATFDATRQFARASVVSASGQAGLVLLGSSGRGLVVAWNSGTLFIYWYLGGINQGNLTTVSSTIHAGDVIEALVDGGTVYAKINGAVVASVANTTSLTSGRPGFETYLTGGSLDDWEAGPPPSDCSGLPDGTPCGDGEAVCTPTDTCQSGACVGIPLSCDDGNPCTADSCTPGVGCQHPAGNSGAVCRAAAGACDVTENCDGASSACPADQHQPNGTPCDDGSTCTAGDVCDGTGVCSGGPSPELCDGIDNDCNSGTLDGSGDPATGLSCDGADSDLCAEGVTACTGGTIVCGDTSGDNLDLCNGADDDCDPASADGSEDPGVGVACDGADSDLCNEGATVCTGGSITCSDTTGSTLDLCNGADDDCDPASADGSEDPGVGVACDGADSDLCAEGVTVCTGGSITCSDTTGSTLDLCNGADDDCDP